MVASRGKGGSRKSLQDDCPEFFKVFLPDRSSQQLGIPPAFIKNLNEGLSNKVTLKDVNGKLWTVDVEETADGTFFKNDWQSFVYHHSLKFGEFLIFRYDGNSSFSVKVYGADGCKKEALVTEKVGPKIKVEEDTEGPKIKIKQETEADENRHKSAHRNKQIPPQKQLRKPAKSNSRREGHQQKSPGRTPIRGSIYKTSNTSTALIPHFFASITISKLYVLNIPSRLLPSVKLMPNMVLCNCTGKEWPVEIVSSADGRTLLAKGWGEFRKENNLNIGDSCRIIFDHRRVSKKIRVEVCNP